MNSIQLQEVHADQESTIVYTIMSDSLREAGQKFFSKRVFSMPVFESESSQKFIGLLTLDVLAGFIIDLFSERASLHNSGDPSTLFQRLESHPFTKDDVETITEKFNSAHVRDLKLVSVETLPLTATLRQAIDVLSSGTVQRLPIVNSEGKIVKILSQSSLVNFLSHHLSELLGDASKHSLIELNMSGAPAVVSANANQKAISTFARMLHLRYFSLGILDPDTKHPVILTMITLKDFEISFVDFQRLLLPTADFITLARQMHLKDINPTINCSGDDTLEKVIKKFAATKIHRLFIRDPNSHELTSILSLNHIVKYLATRDN